MTKEVRSIYLASLTLIFYALSIYFTDGSFVFPFPLNPIIFFIVTVQFAYWHSRKSAVIWLIFASALFGFLASPFIWEILLSVETLRGFYSYPFIYWFEFLSAGFVVIWSIVIALKQKQLFASALSLLGAGGLSYGFYTGDHTFILGGLAMTAIGILIKPVHQPFFLLWYLLLILESTRFMMTFFL